MFQFLETIDRGTKKEPDRPRMGRTVRREGKAETIANERAALADSLANAPGWSVIE